MSVENCSLKLSLSMLRTMVAPMAIRKGMKVDDLIVLFVGVGAEGNPILTKEHREALNQGAEILGWGVGRGRHGGGSVRFLHRVRLVGLSREQSSTIGQRLTLARARFF
jgi:hypothetical protein